MEQIVLALGAFGGAIDVGDTSLGIMPPTMHFDAWAPVAQRHATGACHYRCQF